MSFPANVKGTPLCAATSKHIRTNAEHIKAFAKLHKATRVALIFWNAPHDVAVLKTYFGSEDKLPFSTHDLLASVRRDKRFDFPKYDLDTVHASARSSLTKRDLPEFTRHSALGDAVRLREIHLGLDLDFPRIH